MIEWEKAQAYLIKVDPILGLLIPAYTDRLQASPDGFRTLANAIVGQQISVKAAASIWARLNKHLAGAPDFEPALLEPEATFQIDQNLTKISETSEKPTRGGGTLNPAAVLAASDEELRACGLSFRKVEYLRGIALAFQEDRLGQADWPSLGDEELLGRLIELRGIGRWTAEMFLIFHLERPDLLPLDDIGLLRAAGEQYGWFVDLQKKREAEKNAKFGDSSVTVAPKLKESQLRADYKEIARRLKIHAEIWRPYRTVATWYLWRWLDSEPVVY